MQKAGFLMTRLKEYQWTEPITGIVWSMYEPRLEKSCIRGFLSGPQKMVRGLKFRIWEEEGLYYICSENTGDDQLRGAVTTQLICAYVLMALS